MKFLTALTLLILLAGLAAPAYASSHTCTIPVVWTNDGPGRLWSTDANWSTGAAPKTKDQCVTIPDMGDQQSSYPVFATADTIKIGSLTITGFQSDWDELTFDATGTLKELVIVDRDGLVLSDNRSNIKLQRNSELWVTGGGVLDSIGDIVFNASDDPPKFVLGNGTTLTVTGGLFTGVTKGLITGEVDPGADLAETLVLVGTGGIRGFFDIDVILVNNGYVHTSPNADVPYPGSVRGTINLTCHPKTGWGSWMIDGGTGAGNKSKLVLDTGLVASGDITIEEYGYLRVRRPTSIIQGLHGGPALTLKEGGKFRVKTDRVFDADRWKLQCVVLEP